MIYREGECVALRQKADVIGEGCAQTCNRWRNLEIMSYFDILITCPSLVISRLYQQSSHSRKGHLSDKRRNFGRLQENDLRMLEEELMCFRKAWISSKMDMGNTGGALSVGKVRYPVEGSVRC
jgi:hypothetical protein